MIVTSSSVVALSSFTVEVNVVPEGASVDIPVVGLIAISSPDSVVKAGVALPRVVVPSLTFRSPPVNDATAPWLAPCC